MEPGAFLKSLADEQIVAAIRAAEAVSRGEIRVHVAEREVTDPRTEAALVFEKLGMADTAEHNGVLLFVAPASQSITILGDRAAHERCGEAFWTAVVESVRDEFRAGRYTEGIVAAVRAVGDELARHFPRRPGEKDANELPNAVSRG
ncbi:MAG TPA: TPM domain-containing protein [Vicinamibacteria bacterium]|nr:TPM domain-containing protein [Vicinamibacteria bacterium]